MQKRVWYWVKADLVLALRNVLLCHAYLESMTLRACTAGGKYSFTAMHVDRAVKYLPP